MCRADKHDVLSDKSRVSLFFLLSLSLSLSRLDFSRGRNGSREGALETRAWDLERRLRCGRCDQSFLKNPAGEASPIHERAVDAIFRELLSAQRSRAAGLSMSRLTKMRRRSALSVRVPACLPAITAGLAQMVRVWHDLTWKLRHHARGYNYARRDVAPDRRLQRREK